MEAKLKHLEFIQAVIARMATNQFLFKGWAITIAAALSAFAAVDTRWALLVVALASTLLFWGLDGYYLWLEHGFVKLHNIVAVKDEADIDFTMKIDKSNATSEWLRTCMRHHLYAFYGIIVIVDCVGIVVIKSVVGGK